MSFLIPGNKFNNTMEGPTASLGGRGIWVPSQKPTPQPQPLGSVIPKPLPMNGINWGDLGSAVQKMFGGMNQGRGQPGERASAGMYYNERGQAVPSRGGMRPRSMVPRRRAAPQTGGGLQTQPLPPLQNDLLPAGQAPRGGINPNANDNTAPPMPTGQMGGPIDFRKIEEILAGMGDVSGRQY